STLADNAFMNVHDPEYNYLFTHPTTYTDRFNYNHARARVVLRFDDTELTGYPDPCHLTVTYTIIKREIDGDVVMLDDQELTVNYDPDGIDTYKVLAILIYDDAVWATVIVTDVDALTMPDDEVPFDCYLDLEID